MFQQLLAKFAADAVQHLLTGVGAILVANGLADQSEIQPVIGSAVCLVGFAFSVYGHWAAQKKLAAAQIVQPPK